MKKLVSVCLCLFLILGCVGTVSAEGEKTTLKIWVPENLRIEDWKTNSMTQILEKEGNFDLEFETLPSGDDFLSKINMALTSGALEDLPDVILSLSGVPFADTNVWQWAQAGAILPLTEYYNNPELAVNINKAIERTGTDYTKQITSPDGNIYGVATLNQSYGNEYPHKMWYSKSWLAALGAEEPKTTDEFYALLKKVHDTDLNGNGKADEIGLIGTFGSGLYTGWFPYLMNAFVYAGDANYRTVDNGVVGLAYTTDAWKEGIKFVRKLFEEGLIASESLTMDDEQFKALMNSEDQSVFAMDYAAPDMLAADGPRVTEYNYLAPLTGPQGVQYATYAKSVANISFVVTANCKNPEAAFRLGDLMSSEEMGITQRWGKEGSEWDYIANVADASKYAPSVSSFPLSIVTYHDAQFWGGSDLTNGSWRQHGPYVRHYGIAAGVGIDPTKTEPYTIILNGAWDLYQQGKFNPSETIPKLIYTSDESDAVSELASNLKTYVNEKTAAFLNGNEDIDAGWEAFQEELKNIGTAEFLEIQQTVYDRMYK